MIFRTYSGSLYELDRINERIRRILGQYNPESRRVGLDGEWQKYHAVGPVSVGKSVMIEWYTDITPAPRPGCLPITMTSLVQEILEGEVLVPDVTDAADDTTIGAEERADDIADRSTLN